MQKITTYRISWWDAYGQHHYTHSMDKQSAENLLANMHPSQSARLIVFSRFSNEVK